jgi:hypothetical protein
VKGVAAWTLGKTPEARAVGDALERRFHAGVRHHQRKVVNQAIREAFDEYDETRREKLMTVHQP